MNAFRSQYPAGLIKILKLKSILLKVYIVHPYAKAELCVLGLAKDLRDLCKILDKFFKIILEKVFSLDNETSLIL